MINMVLNDFYCDDRYDIMYYYNIDHVMIMIMLIIIKRRNILGVGRGVGKLSPTTEK